MPCISGQSAGLGRSRGARIGRGVHSAAMLLLPASPAVLKPNLGEGEKRDHRLIHTVEAQRLTTRVRKRERF